jgi:hypothetical protein
MARRLESTLNGHGASADDCLTAFQQALEAAQDAVSAFLAEETN